MFESVITSKGQTTLPKGIREAVSLGPGDKVRYAIHCGGVWFKKAEPVGKLRGFLQYDGPPLSAEDMRRGVIEGAARRFSAPERPQTYEQSAGAAGGNGRGGGGSGEAAPRVGGGKPQFAGAGASNRRSAARRLFRREPFQLAAGLAAQPRRRREDRVIALNTNVLVRYLVRDDPLRSDIAQEILEGLTDEEPGFISREVAMENRLGLGAGVQIFTRTGRGRNLGIDGNASPRFRGRQRHNGRRSLLRARPSEFRGLARACGGAPRRGEPSLHFRSEACGRGRRGARRRLERAGLSPLALFRA